ncbi:hypothetical protein STEG23_005115, partial [Scotinomys teguina]
MCRLSWFLDPGGWGKAAVVGLYFIFPGICTLSLVSVRNLKMTPVRFDFICLTFHYSGLKSQRQQVNPKNVAQLIIYVIGTSIAMEEGEKRF